MTDDGTDGVGGTSYTLDDLSDYLDRGRQPAIAEIDNSPECQSMLASMERVGMLSRELLAHDVEQAPAVEEGWLGELLGSISREVRAGRDIPLSSAEPGSRLSITEGAVRELVRAAGDSVDGVLVGSCSLAGELDGGGVVVSLTISVLLNTPVHVLAEAVRQRVYSELLKHTELTVTAVDVTVSDVHVITTEGPSDD